MFLNYQKQFRNQEPHLNGSKMGRLSVSDGKHTNAEILDEGKVARVPNSSGLKPISQEQIGCNHGSIVDPSEVNKFSDAIVFLFKYRSGKPVATSASNPHTAFDPVVKYMNIGFLVNTYSILYFNC